MTNFISADVTIDTGSPYSEQFNQLVEDMQYCMQNSVHETDRYKNCFWIAIRHYRNLKQLVLKRGFADSFEEINFFRDVKPKFACFVEFFVIASEAVWFADNSAECSHAFWEEEAEKYSRFCKRHSPFIDYYESGNRYLDEEYFLQETADPLSDIYSRMFDGKPFLHSSKDWLVRSYLAHKMYFRFVQEKLKKYPQDNL
jgi:hypothetical protein